MAVRNVTWHSYCYDEFNRMFSLLPHDDYAVTYRFYIY